ncbi:MAG: exodeoxyribonuclease VII large subunit [Bacteroidetes bacterium]|nr:exodeoxyribonuclease VII large subunit [Bacteroidota bacterium]
MKPYLPLSAFLQDIRDTLDAQYHGDSFRILAETTDVKVYKNRGYAFLTLLEKRGNDIVAQAGAVIWRDCLHLVQEFEKATGVAFEQNLEMVLEVEVQYNIRYGLRLNVVGIDTAYTLGKLEQEKDKVLQRLATEIPSAVWFRDGEWHSANQRQKLPTIVQRIALISAPGSDGRRDFLHELQENEYDIAYAVVEFPAQVQGEYAGSQIAAQLQRINQTLGAFDCVAIVRGGGSNMDLNAFDHFDVAHAIALCPYAVITGIGHERNVSISDMLSAFPQKTPTKSAAFITTHNTGFLADLQRLQQDIKQVAGNLLLNAARSLEQTSTQLRKTLGWRLNQEKNLLQQFALRSELLNPSRTLARGYILLRKENKITGSAASVTSGDKVILEFYDGKRKAIIE